ncbi:hypothetical protein J8M97_20560 [Gordonia polyisoprenivorans]|uniref:hypothetical protein n=1 Tax=Gordonia polyisoprenivorans TaxID=84595 RepID=UPI001B8BCFDE|nr:hypothetical protein [Gordonia polyisoprenivorans]QUD82102.1 hypothetical protein J8M97_20560 [Gordonia polyisoprenivorans]
MHATPHQRHATAPTRQDAALASDDDLTRDLMFDALAHVEPLTLDDLLDVADLVDQVITGRMTSRDALGKAVTR